MGDFATVLVAALTLLTGYLSFRTARISKSVDEIHVLVNSRMSDALKRIDQLVTALEGSDVDVPIEPPSRPEPPLHPEV